MVSGLLPHELTKTLSLSPPYRGKQIFGWIHRKGAIDFDVMSDLPPETRKRLSKNNTVRSAVLANRSRDTEGEKITTRCADGTVVEAVCLHHPKGDGSARSTFCLSSQAGCAMECLFCRTGSMGFRRNLSSAEIIDQVLILRDLLGKPSNIVFMGMGEPLLNRKAVYRALDILCHQLGMAMSPRRITISTCGIPDGIIELSDTYPEVRLAVSLVSAEEDVRLRLMPVAGKTPLNDLHDALRYYQRKGNRITLEYVLFEGLNNTIKAVNALVDFCKDLSIMVNVIPWNQFDTGDSGRILRPPSGGTTGAFLNTLRKRGLNATLRRSKGKRINGACGLLASTPNS